VSTHHPTANDGDGGSGPLSPALRQALIIAVAQHRASLDALRDAVCAYVEDLRARGMAAPDIAGALRDRVAELRAANRMAAPEAPDDVLLDQLVDWCVGNGPGTP
jgi:hypothetical protein